jgi:hypothetical protein
VTNLSYLCAQFLGSIIILGFSNTAIRNAEPLYNLKKLRVVKTGNFLSEQMRELQESLPEAEIQRY